MEAELARAQAPSAVQTPREKATPNRFAGTYVGFHCAEYAYAFDRIVGEARRRGRI